MVRIKNSVASHARKKKVLKEAAGQFGHRSRRYQQAKRSRIKGKQYATRDRKVRKREFRSLWIIRINAACRELGVSYNRFINGLNKAGVVLDRKMMSELAIQSPESFKQLVELSKATLADAK